MFRLDWEKYYLHNHPEEIIVVLIIIVLLNEV